MPNHRSALKRLRQSEKRRLRNKAVKSAIKTAIKMVRVAIEEGKPEDASAHLGAVVRLLDRAVTKGVLHRNNASRRISRLTVAVNSISQNR